MPETLSKQPRRAPSGKYARQRSKVTPPHVGLAALRAVGNMTLEQVTERLMKIRPDQPQMSRGTLSAIEKGHRGVSPDMLAALELAYKLPPGTITTSYVPRAAAG